VLPSKKRVVRDETLLPADEAEKLLAKRAYNRECASRARKRGKELIIQLEKQVKELQSDKNELRRSMASMEEKIKVLEEQNRSLLARQRMTNFDGTIAGSMLQQITASQFPLRGAMPSSTFNRPASGTPFFTQSQFY
jgi:chromosome segregation ATPase